MDPTQNEETIFFGRNNKSISFQKLYFIKISVLAELWTFFYFVWCFFIKKESFPAKTAVTNLWGRHLYINSTKRTSMVHDMLSFHSQQFYSFISFIKIPGKNVQGNSISLLTYLFYFLFQFFFSLLFMVYLLILIPLSLETLDQPISVAIIVVKKEKKETS